MRDFHLTVIASTHQQAIGIGIDNLFNAEYEEDPGIPMPGITGTAAVEVNF